MIKAAIILAGGLGTRLRSVIDDRPKCLAPIDGKPFLDYLLAWLQNNGVEHFIFSVGHLFDQIQDHLWAHHSSISFQLAIEETPLGTGGGIQLACEQSNASQLFVCNGDTLFDVDLKALSDFHQQHNAMCSLALKPMQHFERYGSVEIDERSAITAFKEKSPIVEGLINGGVYALDKSAFLKKKLEAPFSFEKDFLEKEVSPNLLSPAIFGQIQNQYFIDIGIPEDYEKAQIELKDYLH